MNVVEWSKAVFGTAQNLILISFHNSMHLLMSLFGVFIDFRVSQGPPGLPGLGGPKGEKVRRRFPYLF